MFLKKMFTKIRNGSLKMEYNDKNVKKALIQMKIF